MRVVLVLPRHMHFAPDRATSIDLCAYELLRHSRFRAETRVICAEEAEYLPGVDIKPFSAGPGSLRRIMAISREINRFRPDIIVVHQHLRTVFLLSMLHRSTPIVLHRHNYYSAKLSFFSRLAYHFYWKRIAAVFFVSESCRSGFLSHSEIAQDRTFVVPNGLDFSEWRPREERSQTVVFVGRAVPEKGVLEAAKATATALLHRPDWSALFYLAQPEKNQRYAAEVAAALAPLGGRAQIIVNAAFGSVKASFEEAAIALTPSIWNEPFGRTAIEAMAGGAALICSGRGGLEEVIGSVDQIAALQTEPTVHSLLEAINRLIDDAQLRGQIAKRGGARVRELFAIDAIADHYDRYLENIVRGSQAPYEMFQNLTLQRVADRANDGDSFERDDGTKVYLRRVRSD